MKVSGISKKKSDFQIYKYIYIPNSLGPMKSVHVNMTTWVMRLTNTASIFLIKYPIPNQLKLMLYPVATLLHFSYIFSSIAEILEST